MNCIRLLILVIPMGVLLSPAQSFAQESVANEVEIEELSFVTQFKHPALQRPASVSVSRDGKFIYAAGYGAHSCVVVKHNRETETLEYVQTLDDNASFASSQTAIRKFNSRKVYN